MNDTTVSEIDYFSAWVRRTRMSKQRSSPLGVEQGIAALAAAEVTAQAARRSFASGLRRPISDLCFDQPAGSTSRAGGFDRKNPVLLICM